MPCEYFCRLSLAKYALILGLPLTASYKANTPVYSPDFSNFAIALGNMNLRPSKHYGIPNC